LLLTVVCRADSESCGWYWQPWLVGFTVIRCQR